MNSAVCLLERAAKLFADRPAVEDEVESLNYTQYRALSRRIATAMLQAGSARKPIIMYLPKSVEMLCCFMGAMYAGSPYAPVDSHIPMNRLEKIAESLQPGLIVTSAELAKNLENCDIHGAKVVLASELRVAEEDTVLVDAATAKVVDSDPIYIMYTSGSTGTPKGVTIPHRGIIDYADWVVNTFHFDETTVMANQAPFYFDNSTFDIYGCLQCGGKMILIPDVLMMFPVRLPEFLAEKEVTSIFWVPTVMINVANSGVLETVQLPKLKNVAFCGEVMPNKQLNIWRKHLPQCTYANLYGPTEITDVCCYYIVDREYADSDPLPIGKACENMRVVILTDDNQAAEVGQMGELCVIGSGVALGYWNAPEITNKVFVQNPLSGQYRERMYRTGDLAYWDAEGLIQFCGRKDNQIKLKGNRIELGEIETAAMCVEGVENAAAIFDADQELIALYVETQGTLPARRFNMELKKHIPAYMVPGKLICMEKLPHTANDKIDRVTLKKMLKGEA